VLVSSSYDRQHPPSNIIDGRADTYWVSTGLFPQFILLTLGRKATKVSSLELAATNVRKLLVEGCEDLGLSRFQVLGIAEFKDSCGDMQLEEVRCTNPKGNFLPHVRYLRITVLAGWGSYCSIKWIRAVATPAAADDEESEESPSPGSPKAFGDVGLRIVPGQALQHGMTSNLALPLDLETPGEGQPTSGTGEAASQPIPAVAISGNMQSLRLTGPNGVEVEVLVDSGWRLSDLKKALEGQVGIPRTEQRLLLGPLELADGLPLAVALTKASDVDRKRSAISAGAGDDGDGTTGGSGGGSPTTTLLEVGKKSARQPEWVEQVSKDGLALRFAQDLSSDREVALTAVRHNGDALQFAATCLRSDSDFVVEAVQRRGSSLRWAAEALRGDFTVALAAVGQNGNALQFCDEALRNDRRIVLAAVSQTGAALRFATQSLRSDPEVVEVAGRSFYFTKQELADMASSESKTRAGDSEDGTTGGIGKMIDSDDDDDDEPESPQPWISRAVELSNAQLDGS